MLFALPGTQLTRRLEKEGRLHSNHDLFSPGDQCTHGLNFDPARPLRDILVDYKNILERIFDPVAYAGRLDRLVSMLDRSGSQRELPEGDLRSKFGTMEKVHRIMGQLPMRERFWKILTNCVKKNPRVMTSLMMLMAVYLHLGPYSRFIISAMDRRIAEIDAKESVPLVAAE